MGAKIPDTLCDIRTHPGYAIVLYMQRVQRLNAVCQSTTCRPRAGLPSKLHHVRYNTSLQQLQVKVNWNQISY